MIGLLFINAISDLLGLMTIGTLIISALSDNIFKDGLYIPDPDLSAFEHQIHLGLRHVYYLSGAENPITFLFYLSILIFIIFIIKNAIFIFISYIQTRFGYNISLRLNQKMFKYYYDQGYLFIKNSTSGNKVYAIVDIPMRFASAYFIPTLIFTTELVVLIIMGIMLIFINPLAVALLIIIIVPVFLLIYRITKNNITKLGYERNKIAPLGYAKVYEAMYGYVDVRLSNSENSIANEYEELQRKLNATDAVFVGIYQRINSRMNDIIFGLGIMVIFGYAYFAQISTKEVLTLLGVFAIAAYKFLPSINKMLNAIMTIKNSSFVIDELNVIANTNLSKFPKAVRLNFEKEIKLDNLSYQYPNSDDYILKDINLTIKKGKSLGIIGESGSGKTTLLRIILRLMNQDGGSIYLDDKLITVDDNHSFQQLFGYVEQDIFIINGSIRANIAFGDNHPNDLKIWKALKQSRLQNFVEKQKDGLDSMIGENGVNLSGGQKQRIGIARALYKESEILCFDEATSALDSETERAIVESINDLAALGKTVIIVAHRITTLEKCNRIIELDYGKIRREPSYTELIKEKIHF